MGMEGMAVIVGITRDGGGKKGMVEDGGRWQVTSPMKEGGRVWRGLAGMEGDSGG